MNRTNVSDVTSVEVDPNNTIESCQALNMHRRDGGFLSCTARTFDFLSLVRVNLPSAKLHSMCSVISLLPPTAPSPSQNSSPTATFPVGELSTPTKASRGLRGRRAWSRKASQKSSADCGFLSSGRVCEGIPRSYANRNHSTRTKCHITVL